MLKTLRGRRWTGWSKRQPSLLRPFPVLRVEELEARTVPATFTWTGAGSNPNWSTAANWAGGTAPNPLGGDDLRFPVGTPVRTTVNDFTNASFNSITVSDSDYTLQGNQLRLANTVVVGSGLTRSKIDLDVQLTATAGSKQFFTVGNNTDFTINGKISGSTGAIFTKDGTGILILTGDNSSFTGDMYIDTAGALEIRHPQALGDTVGRTIVAVTGVLRVNNVVGNIAEPLTLNGAGFDNLGAVRSVGGNANTWSGPVVVDSNSTFGATNGTTISFTNTISDTGAGHNIRKEDEGTVVFAAANSYRGTTSIDDGVLRITHPNALGATAPGGSLATGTTVNRTLGKEGQLQVSGGFTVLNERLALNGEGFGGTGALLNASGDNNWAGPVVLGTPGTTSATQAFIGIAPNSNMIISGVVSATFPLIKVLPGTLILNNANTYNGGTVVAQGILNIRNSQALGTFPVGVSNGATLQLEVEAATSTPRFGYNQTTGEEFGRDLWADATNNPNRLSVNNFLVIDGFGVGGIGALHNLSGTNKYTASIALTQAQSAIGVAQDARDGHPTPTSDYFTDDYSLTTTQAIVNLDPPGTPATLVKRGAGHLIFPTTNTYTGQTLIQQGWITARVGGALSNSSDTVVSNGAALHLFPSGGALTINQDLTLAGDGIAHNYTFINGKGALMNLAGANFWGSNTVNGDGDLTFAGTSGIGVESVFGASELTIRSSISESAAGSGLNKWGSQRLTLLGDGTYRGAVNVHEGIIQAGHNQALGWSTSGTFNSQQVYTQSDTNVARGSVIELRETVANNSGQLVRGIQIADERLVLGGQGQQLHVAGDTTNLHATYTITYTSPTAGSFTTASLHVGATAQQVEDALNFVDPITQTTPSLVQTDGQRAVVTKVGNVFRIEFGNALSLPVPTLIATPIVPPSGFTDAEVRITDGTNSVLNSSNDNSWRGPVTLLGGARMSTAANTRLNLLGVIDDSPSTNGPGSHLVKRGAGDLLLAGTNSYRGQTLISQGVVTALNGLAFGFGDTTTGTGTTVAAAAQMQISGGLTFPSERLTVQGTGTATASTLTDQWFNVGPMPTNNGQAPNNQPTTGRITSIATDPTNPLFMYVATAGGGAWKTKDGGLTWHPLFEDTADAAATMYGSQIVVATSNILYFATGEANGANNGTPVPGPNDNFVSSGVYRSADAGMTWTLLTGSDGQNPLFGQTVTKLLVDPLNANRIYASTSTVNARNTYATAPTPIAGVYRYEVGGEWVNLTGNASPRRLGNLGQAPFDAAIDTNTNRQNPGAPGNAGPDDDYRIRFPQGGAVGWSDIFLVKEGDLQTSIPYDRGNHDADGNAYVLYAALGSSTQNPFVWSGTIGDPVIQGTFNAVYRTENPIHDNPTWWLGEGSVFPPLDPSTNQPLPKTESDQRAESSYYPIGSVTASPAGINEWIKVTGEVNAYFTAYADPQITVYTSNLTSNAARRGELLGLNSSSATGGITGSWSNVAPPTTPAFGLTNTAVPTYATGLYQNNLLLTDTSPGLLGNGVASDVILGGKDSLFRLAGGTAGIWTDLSAAAGTTVPAGNFHTSYLHPASSQLLLGSDGGIWGLPNGATNFRNLNGTLSVTLLNSADAHPTDINQAYAGSYNNGIQQFDGSLDWSRVNTALGNGTSNGDNTGAVRYDPRNPNTAYSVQNGRIYRTDNNGMTWTEVLNASTNSNIVPLVVDALNTNRILVGTDTALLESTNRGGSFTSLQAPFAPTSIAAAHYQGPFVDDPDFPQSLVPDQLSNTYVPDTIYIANSTDIAVTKNRGLDWATRTPGIVDNRYRLNFGGFLRYKQIPQVTVTTSSPNVYATVKTLNDGFDDFRGYPTYWPDDAGLGEMQSIELVALEEFLTETFEITFDFSAFPGGAVITTAPIAIDATTDEVDDAIAAVLDPLGMTGRDINRIEIEITDADPTLKLIYNKQETADIPITPGGDDSAAIRDELDLIGADFDVFLVGPNTYEAVSRTNTNSLPLFGTASNAFVNVYEIQQGGQAVVGALGFGNEVVTVEATSNLADAPLVTLILAGESIGPFDPRATTAQQLQDLINQNNTYVLNNGTVSVTKTSIQLPAAPLTPTQQIDTFVITFSGGALANRNASNMTAPFILQDQVTVNLTRVDGGRTQGSGVTFTNLVVNQANRDEIFATARYVNSQNGPVLFRSLDAGQTWEDITGNLPTVQTWTAAYDPRDNTLYIGGDKGVFRLESANTVNAFAWTKFGNGLENVQVKDLVLNQSLNTLTVATYGRGMFQLFLTDYQANSGAVRALSGNSTWGGPVVLAGNTRFEVDGTQNLQNGIAAASLNILGSISSPGGDFNIVKEGEGTLILSAANTYGGVTFVENGVLQVNHPNALGDFDAASNTIVQNGAALELATDLYREPVTLRGDGFSFNGHNTGALRNVTGFNTYTGPLTFETNTTIGANSGTQLTIGAEDGDTGYVNGNGFITDNGNNFSLTKELTGTLVLGNANVYGGNTNVLQGALRVSHANALGSTAAGTFVTVGAALEMSRNNVTRASTIVVGEPLQLTGTGIFNTGALRNVRGDTLGDSGGFNNDNTWRGPIQLSLINAQFPTVNATRTVALGSSVQSDTLFIDTNMTQVAGAGFVVNKQGAGRVTFMQNNSYGGQTNVNEGYLRIMTNGGLGTLGAGTVVNVGGTLELDGSIAPLNPTETLTINGDGVNGVGALNNVIADNSYSGPITIGSNASIGAEPTTTLTILGALQDPAQGAVPAVNAVPGRLRKAGQGTVVLPDPKSYSGATEVADGILNIRNATSLGTPRDEVQFFQVLGTSGSFALSFKGASTPPLQFNATATDVENALEALPTMAGMALTVGFSTPGGINTYTVTFSAGTLQNFEQEQILPIYIAPTINTATNGTASLPEVQTVRVSASQGFFGLTFNGARTRAIPVNASQGEVQSALNALATIDGVSGSVIVNRTGTLNDYTYTVQFAGSLATGNQTQMTSTIVAGTNVTGSTNRDGQRGTTVLAGATLQLQGGMTFDFPAAGELITLNGQGFNGMGALNVLGGSVTFQNDVPLLLGSDASISVTNAGDTLTINSLISDAGGAHDLDIYGLGTVRYNGNGSGSYSNTPYSGYTGTTTVHEGTLELNVSTNPGILGDLVVGDAAAPNAVVRYFQNNQIANTSDVTVRSDGTIFMDGFDDTIGTLTMIGGDVHTGNTGHLVVTGPIDMSAAAEIHVGNDASLTGGPTTMVDSDIHVGTNSSVNVNGDLSMNNSGIDYAPPGPGFLTVTGNLTMTNGSQILVNPPGGQLTISTQDIYLDASFIDLNDNGTITSRNVTLLNAAHIRFEDSGNFTATGAVSVSSGSDIRLDANGRFDIGGKLTLSNGEVSLGDATAPNVVPPTRATLTAAEIDMTGGTSQVNIGDYGYLAVVGKVTAVDGDINFGQNGTFTAGGNVALSAGAKIDFAGPNGFFNNQPADLTLNASEFHMANAGTAKTRNVTMSNDALMRFEADGELISSGNLTMTGASDLVFGFSGKATTNTVAITGGTIDFGDDGELYTAGVTNTGAAIGFDLNGTFQAGGTVNVLGGGTIGFGDAPTVTHTVTGGDSGYFKATGALNLDNGRFWMGDNGEAEMTGLSLANASKMTFDNGGKLTDNGPLTMNGSSEIRFRNGGMATADDLTQNGGIIEFVDGGTLDTDAVILSGGTIQFQDGGNFTPDGVTASNGFITFRDTGTFNANGNVTLNKTALTFRDGANADMLALSTTGATTITMRDNGKLDTTTVNVTTGATLTFGNDVDFTAAGNVSIANSNATFGTLGDLDVTGNLTMSNSPLSFGDNGLVNVHGAGAGNVNLSSAAKITFTNSGSLVATGNVGMVGTSRLIYGLDGLLQMNNLSITTGSIAMGNGADILATGTGTIAGAAITVGTGSKIDFDGDVSIAVSGASPASLTVGANSTVDTGNLTITTATLNFGAMNVVTTGDVSLTGTSKVTLGADSEFNAGNVTSQPGTWTFGSNNKLNSTGAVSFTNSLVTFATGGKLTAADDLTLDNTTMTFNTSGGTVAVEDVFVNNKSKLTIASGGSLTANGPLNDKAGVIEVDNAQIRFTAAGSITGGNTKLTTSGSIQATGGLVIDLGSLTIDNGDFVTGNGSSGTFDGNMKVDDGTVLFGSNSNIDVLGDLTGTGSDLTFGNTGSLTVTGDVNVNLFTISVGNIFTFEADDVTLQDTSYTQGDFGSFTAVDLALTDSVFTMGEGNTGAIDDLGIVNSTMSLGLNTTVAIGGNITADSSATGVSSISGDGGIDLGTATHGLDVGNGDAADTVDFTISAEILSSGAARFTKTGAGRVDLADPTGATVDIAIAAGDVQVTSSAGDIELTGGTLSGGGSVGTIGGASGGPAVGLVSPGNNWDLAKAADLASLGVTFGPQTTFHVDLSSSVPGSPQPGVDYDQLNATGDVQLGDAVLTATFGPGILLNDTFTIVTATSGTITGKFQQFNSQDIIFVGGQKFDIIYNPTSVVLQKVRANATVSVTSNTPNPSTLNQNVTIVATVVPELGSSLITGSMTVTFLDNGNAMSSVLIVENTGVFTATYSLTSLTVGLHDLTASFSGDANNFNPSTSPPPAVVQEVQQPYADALSAAPSFVSPSNPSSAGVQDTYSLSTTVRDERGAINWSIAIRNASNVTVRTLAGSGSPGSGTTIPIAAIWDGRDTGGTVVTDGTYTATLTVNDSFGNTFGVPATSVVIDNTSPTATLGTPSNVAIDPTASSVLPSTTTFTGTVGDTNLTGWVLSIRNGASLLRSFSGTGTAVNVTWNGFYDPLDATDPVSPTTQAPDAAYTITLTSVDAAGNNTTTATQTVVVLANGPIVTVTSNTPTIYGQSFTLTAAVTLPPGSPTALIDLLNGDTVRFFRGATLIGTDTLEFNSGTGRYEATSVQPTLDAGTYTNFSAVYVASSDFPQGTSAQATHVINPASLTVTAQNKTRTYGAANPPLTYTVSGLVNGDTASVLSGALTTAANAASNVGTYPIMQGNVLPNNGNYVITTFNPGVLTVTPAFLTLDIDDKSRPVNTPNPAFTFTVLGLLNGDPASVVSSLPMSTTAVISSPVGSYPITASGPPVVTSPNYVVSSIVPGSLAVTPVLTNFAAGMGASVDPRDPSRVIVYSPTGSVIRNFTPFGSFSGGIRTAVADFNGDGAQDVAVATGPGAQAQVTIFSGTNNAPLFNLFPFDTFTGGSFVAAGDIDADGVAELVITPDEGGGPRVLIVKGGTFEPFLSYFGINDPAFRGGARAGVGDMNGDGYAEIAVSAGFQGGPRISIWDGKFLAASQFRNTNPDFFAFDQSLRNGAYVAIGDVDGDGFGDLIAGAGPGGAPHVKVFSGVDMLNPAIGPSNTVPFASLFAGDSNNRGGVRVAAKVLDADLFVDVVTGAGDAGGDAITTYLGSNLVAGGQDFEDMFDFPGMNNNGVFVG